MVGIYTLIFFSQAVIIKSQAKGKIKSNIISLILVEKVTIVRKRLSKNDVYI